jgi:ribonuclease HI
MLEVAKTTDTIKRSKFMEIMTNFGDHLAIFTDGSKTVSSCGFAATTNEEIIVKKRISTISSIYTAEIRTLIHSIEAKKHYRRKIVLYTDSLSSTLATINRKTKDAEAIHLANLLYENCSQFIITWVPSHCGIIGNEKADQLAKETSNLIIDTSETISKNNAYHLVKIAYSNCQNNINHISRNNNNSVIHNNNENSSNNNNNNNKNNNNNNNNNNNRTH